MTLNHEQIAGLNVALNEATMLGAEVDTERRLAGVTLSVLTLPDEGAAPDDPRVQFLFHPVGRVAASLRLGNWNDSSAEVVPFEVGELSQIVESFKLPIYGWKFFDLDDDFDQWKDRFSVDYRLGDDGLSHSVTLFQEGPDRHLDLRIWFDSFGLQDVTGRVLEIADFIAGGKRWWDGLYSGDPRAKGLGIVPLRSR